MPNVPKFPLKDDKTCHTPYKLSARTFKFWCLISVIVHSLNHKPLLQMYI